MTVTTIGGEAFVLKPEYLDTRSGKLFVLCIEPRHASGLTRGVIVLPPFAEEMNKSRHMLALLGQRMAHAGSLFVLPDLYGTGDSEGTFEESTWDTWAANIRSVANAMANRGIQSIDVLALRSGIFLISGLHDSSLPDPERVVMWNPVHRGSKMIDQMLRSKVIKESAETNSTNVAAVRHLIERDGDLEVAGYRLTRDLVASVDGLDLSQVLLPPEATIHWIDVSPIATDRVPPVVESMKRTWKTRAESVLYSRVVGPQFWMGPEIDLVPELLGRTAEILNSE